MIVKPRLFWTSHLALLGTLVLWFSPLTHSFCENLDAAVFKVLNGSLAHHSYWQHFWGILNHRREVILNLVMAALFNVWAILATTDNKLRHIRIQQTIYFWIFFQVGFMLQAYFFNMLLQVERDSPSLILQPVVKLSLILQNPNIKDASYHSFPSGHAFALIYWATFTLFCAPKRIARLGMIVAIILSLARLFSGAHWVSDTLFSALLGLVWLSWTLNTPIYHAIMKRGHLLPNT